MMDRMPLEICNEIYAFACLDDGITGRSLSLVSRYVSQSSRPFKYQSVTVVGHGQLVAFANLIEQTPIPYRRVERMFVSAHSRQTASDPRALSPEYVQRQEAYAAVERILTSIAFCVKIIHAFFVFYRPFVLLPVSLPLLEELVLHGPLEISTQLNPNIQFKCLKHVNLTSSCSPSYLLDKVLKQAPSLLHLQVSASDRSENMANEWTSVLKNRNPVLPSHLEKVYIHIPTKPKVEFEELTRVHGRISSALSSLSETDKRVVLLPPLRLDLFSMISIQDAIKIWGNSVTGETWWKQTLQIQESQFKKPIHHG